jgi:hypothetical protein
MRSRSPSCDGACAPRRKHNALTEAAGDVIFSLFFPGIGRDFHRWSEFDEFAEVKEGGEIGHVFSLSYIIEA